MNKRLHKAHLKQYDQSNCSPIRVLEWEMYTRSIGLPPFSFNTRWQSQGAKNDIGEIEKRKSWEEHINYYHLSSNFSFASLHLYAFGKRNPENKMRKWKSTCFVFHVNVDCKSKDIFKFIVTCCTIKPNKTFSYLYD